MILQCWHWSQTLKNGSFAILPNQNLSWMLADLLYQSLAWCCSVLIFVMAIWFQVRAPLSLRHTEQTDGGQPGSCTTFNQAELCHDAVVLLCMCRADLRFLENFVVTAIKMTKHFGCFGVRQQQSRNLALFDCYPMPKWLNLPLGLKFNSEFLNDILWPF